MSARSNLLPTYEADKKPPQNVPIQISTDDDRYYAPYSCQPGCKEDHPVVHALHSYATNSVWLRTEKSKEWSTPTANVEVKMVLGTGQIASPITISDECFADFCTKAGFSPRFLMRVHAKRPFFEYNIHPSKHQPSSLEFGISTYEVDSFLFLLRYDVTCRTLRAIVVFKAKDHLTITPLGLEDIYNWLEASKEDIAEEPLVLIPTLLRLIQHRSHVSVRWRSALYDAEGRLGVTRRRQFLESSGYPEISYKYELLNAELASLGKDLADTRMSASTIKRHVGNFAEIIRTCWDGNIVPAFLEQEINGIINYADAYLLQIETSQTILQGLHTVLYNRINQHDTQATTSLTVIGLIFLPATLVCGVFASGIFKLDNAELPSSVSSRSNQGSSPVVSKYWPIFLSTSIGLTLFTLVLWIIWCYYGREWVDRLSKSNLNGQWPERREIEKETMLRESQIKASVNSKCVNIPILGTGSPCLDGYCAHSDERE